MLMTESMEDHVNQASMEWNAAEIEYGKELGRGKRKRRILNQIVMNGMLSALPSFLLNMRFMYQYYDTNTPPVR